MNYLKKIFYVPFFLILVVVCLNATQRTVVIESFSRTT